MIIFEEKMRELIELLPLLSDSSKVRYEWGTIDVLNKYLTIIDKKSKYPLIWLLTGKSEHNILSSEITRNAKIVIATKSTNVNELNNFQYQNDYKNNLLIIEKWLITLFQKSGITKIEKNSYTNEISPNYSIITKENGVIDIWNAIIIEAKIIMKTNRCINQNIKF